MEKFKVLSYEYLSKEDANGLIAKYLIDEKIEADFVSLELKIKFRRRMESDETSVCFYERNEKDDGNELVALFNLHRVYDKKIT